MRYLLPATLFTIGCFDLSILDQPFPNQSNNDMTLVMDASIDQFPPVDLTTHPDLTLQLPAWEVIYSGSTSTPLNAISGFHDTVGRSTTVWAAGNDIVLRSTQTAGTYQFDPIDMSGNRNYLAIWARNEKEAWTVNNTNDLYNVTHNGTVLNDTSFNSLRKFTEQQTALYGEPGSEQFTIVGNNPMMGTSVTFPTATTQSSTAITHMLGENAIGVWKQGMNGVVIGTTGKTSAASGATWRVVTGITGTKNPRAIHGTSTGTAFTVVYDTASPKNEIYRLSLAADTAWSLVGTDISQTKANAIFSTSEKELLVAGTLGKVSRCALDTVTVCSQVATGIPTNEDVTGIWLSDIDIFVTTSKGKIYRTKR